MEVKVDDNLLVNELPPSVFIRVCALLDKESEQGNDWRDLAQRLRFNATERTIFARAKKGPTDALLRAWHSRDPDGATVGALRSHLRAMKRLDVLQLFGRVPLKERGDEVLQESLYSSTSVAERGLKTGFIFRPETLADDTKTAHEWIDRSTQIPWRRKEAAKGKILTILQQYQMDDVISITLDLYLESGEVEVSEVVTKSEQDRRLASMLQERFQAEQAQTWKLMVREVAKQMKDEPLEDVVKLFRLCGLPEEERLPNAESGISRILEVLGMGRVETFWRNLQDVFPHPALIKAVRPLLAPFLKEGAVSAVPHSDIGATGEVMWYNLTMKRKVEIVAALAGDGQLFFLLGEVLRNRKELSGGDWLGLSKRPGETEDQRRSRITELLDSAKRLSLKTLHLCLQTIREPQLADFVLAEMKEAAPNPSAKLMVTIVLEGSPRSFPVDGFLEFFASILKTEKGKLKFRIDRGSVRFTIELTSELVLLLVELLVSTEFFQLVPERFSVVSVEVPGYGVFQPVQTRATNAPGPNPTEWYDDDEQGLADLAEKLEKAFGGNEIEKRKFCAAYAGTPSHAYQRFADAVHAELKKEWYDDDNARHELAEELDRVFGGNEAEKRKFCAAFMTTPSASFTRFADAVYAALTSQGREAMVRLINGLEKGGQKRALLALGKWASKHNNALPQSLLVDQNAGIQKTPLTDNLSTKGDSHKTVSVGVGHVAKDVEVEAVSITSSNSTLNVGVGNMKKVSAKDIDLTKADGNVLVNVGVGSMESVKTGNINM